MTAATEEWTMRTAVESNMQFDEPLGQTEAPEVKLFGKWSLDEVHISDISLVVFFFSTSSLCLHSPEIVLNKSRVS